jgi:hypothetical protein
MTESINGQAKFRTSLAFRPIISRARFTLRRRSQGSAINNSRRRINISTRSPYGGRRGDPGQEIQSNLQQASVETVGKQPTRTANRWA